MVVADAASSCAGQGSLSALGGALAQGFRVTDNGPAASVIATAGGGNAFGAMCGTIGIKGSLVRTKVPTAHMHEYPKEQLLPYTSS